MTSSLFLNNYGMQTHSIVKQFSLVFTPEGVGGGSRGHLAGLKKKEKKMVSTSALSYPRR